MAGWADSIKFIKSKIFKKIIKNGDYEIKKAENAEYAYNAGHARRLSIDANVWKNIGILTSSGVEYRLERGTYLVKADVPPGADSAAPHVTMLIDIKYAEDADGYCCRSTSFNATNSCYIEYITNTNVLKSNIILINVSMVAIA